MKGGKILFWITVCGFVVLGSCAFFNAVVLIWLSTGPLMHAKLRLDYFPGWQSVAFGLPAMQRRGGWHDTWPDISNQQTGVTLPW